MYIDGNILKLLYLAETDEEAQKVSDKYADGLSEVGFWVLKKYMTDEEIYKPNIAGFDELTKLTPETPEEKKQEVVKKAFLAASVQPEFMAMYDDAIELYNERLYVTQMRRLSDEQVQKILDYLDESDERTKANFKVLRQATRDILLHPEENVDEVENTAPTTPIQETPVVTAPVEPEPAAAPQPVVESVETQPEAKSQPAPKTVTQDEILTPVEEPKPTLPPTSDLPERKISVGTEPEASKPVSFSR